MGLTLVESRCATALLAAAGAVGAGYLLALDPRYVAVPALAALWALVAATAYGRPDLVLAGALVTLGFVPFAAPGTAGPIPLDPATLLLWALVAGLLVRGLAAQSLPSFTLVDAATVAFFLCLAVSVVAGARGGQEYARNIFQWVGPYLALRLALPRLRSAGALARAFVLVAVTLVPLALLEAATHHYLYASTAATTPPERFGTLRVALAFGHPIALAMFLSTAAVLALGLGLASKRGARRAAWVGAAALLALTQSLSLSRLGWVVLVVGTLLLLAGRPGVLARHLAVVPAILVAVVLVLSNAVAPTRALLAGGGTGASGESTRSVVYRKDLVSRALEPGVIKLTGNRERLRGPRQLSSLDDEYIVLADEWGWIGLGGFVAIVAVLLRAAVRLRPDALASGVVAATIANAVALVGVALLVQQQVYIWMLLGAASALTATAAAGRAPQPAMSALLSTSRSAGLMGVELAALTEPQTVAHVCSALSEGRGGSVLTANLEILRQSLRTPEHLRALEEAELVLADGMPLVWACRAQGTPLPERVSGSALIWSLSEAAAAGDASVFLAGGTPGAAERAAGRLVAEYHGLEVAGVACPMLPIGPEDDDAYALLADDLAMSQPDIVFLGLPFAKQVRAIPHLRARLPGSWIVGVGVSFSFVSGELSRAPAWMQQRGLEWVHRLAHQPRLWRRYLLHGVPFALRLGTHALRARRTGAPR